MSKCVDKTSVTRTPLGTGKTDWFCSYLDKHSCNMGDSMNQESQCNQKDEKSWGYEEGRPVPISDTGVRGVRGKKGPRP